MNRNIGLIQVGTLDIKGQDIIKRVYSPEGLCPTLTDMQGGNRQPKVITAAAMRGRYSKGGKVEQQIEISNREYANAITTVQKDSMAAEIVETEPNVLRSVRTEYGKQIRKAYESGDVKESRRNMTELHPRTDGIANTLTTVQKDNYLHDGCLRIRKLTPKECWRLMGFEDSDFEKAEAVNSNTQLYKQAGNSIVVDVLEHLIKGVIDMRLWTDNPERDAEMHYEDTKPKKIGICEHCSDPIFDFEEYYEIHGDMIHDDCLRDWAEQYKES